MLRWYCAFTGIRTRNVTLTKPIDSGVLEQRCVIAMEAQGYLSDEHKKVVEELFGTVNDKLCRLQEDALKFVFPSSVSGKNNSVRAAV